MSNPRGQSLLAVVLLTLVRVYQRLISPLLRALFGPSCRFEPSCSKYAAACIEDHGAWRGGLLSIVRLCKCHPFHPGGVDPPPPRRSMSPPPPPAHAYATNGDREPKALLRSD